MIIFRYLAKEVLTATLVVTLVLLLIFLSNQFVRFLMTIADGDMALSILFQLMELEVPFLLGYLLPIGFFFGILFSYGRMYADSEMTILHASGIGRARLLGMTLLIALPIILVVSSLVFWVAPKMMAIQQKAMMTKGAQMLLSTVVPGRFQTMSGGRQVFYVQSVSRDHKQLQGVFAANYEAARKNEQEGAKWVIYTAHDAAQSENLQSHRHYLLANQGYRFAGVPGSRQYGVTAFGQLGMELASHTAPAIFKEKAIPTAKIWQGRQHNLNYEAEWQWRWSMPFSILVLLLLAVPLSYVNPRQGRYAKLLPAILLYVVYANMLFVGRRWVSNGIVPADIGLWAIHLPMIAFALIILGGERGRYWLTKPINWRWRGQR